MSRQRRAEREVRSLRAEIASYKREVAELDKLLGTAHGIAERIEKKLKKVEQLEKKLQRKLAQSTLSPRLSAIVEGAKDAPNPLRKIVESRFWTKEQRKDMY